MGREGGEWKGREGKGREGEGGGGGRCVVLFERSVSSSAKSPPMQMAAERS